MVQNTERPTKANCQTFNVLALMVQDYNGCFDNCYFVILLIRFVKNKYALIHVYIKIGMYNNQGC